MTSLDVLRPNVAPRTASASPPPSSLVVTSAPTNSHFGRPMSYRRVDMRLSHLLLQVSLSPSPQDVDHPRTYGWSFTSSAHDLYANLRPVSGCCVRIRSARLLFFGRFGLVRSHTMDSVTCSLVSIPVCRIPTHSISFSYPHITRVRIETSCLNECVPCIVRRESSNANTTKQNSPPPVARLFPRKRPSATS